MANYSSSMATASNRKLFGICSHFCTHTHITHVWIIFTYTLLSVTDMASSVKASLEISLSFVLLTGAKEPEWQGLSESPLLYDLRSFQQKSD